MYNSIQIKNFKCIKHLKLDKLKKVNLIGGQNNSGKTSVLEALFILGGRYRPDLVLGIATFRGIDEFRVASIKSTGTNWDLVFHNFDTASPINLKADEQGSESINLDFNVVSDLGEIKKYLKNFPAEIFDSSESEIHPRQPLEILREQFRVDGRKGDMFAILHPAGLYTSPSPPLTKSTILIPARYRITAREDSDRFTSLAKQNAINLLLESLKEIEPRLVGVEILVIGKTPVIFGNIGLKQPVPLSFLGEGVSRLASIILAIGVTKGGYLLLDEIENGFHYSVIPKVWDIINKVSTIFDTQIFATTHSWECVTAAHKTFTGHTEYDFKYSRLEREDGNIRIIDYDQEALENSIIANLDVR